MQFDDRRDAGRQLAAKLGKYHNDGIATGASMRVTIQSVRGAGAKKVVMAVPVAAPGSLHKTGKETDETVCLSSPVHFEAVGSFYYFFE